MKKIIMLLFLLLSLLQTAVFADTIILTNGETISGTIAEQNNNFVRIINKEGITSREFLMEDVAKITLDNITTEYHPLKPGVVIIDKTKPEESKTIETINQTASAPKIKTEVLTMKTLESMPPDETASPKTQTTSTFKKQKNENPILKFKFSIDKKYQTKFLKTLEQIKKDPKNLYIILLIAIIPVSIFIYIISFLWAHIFPKKNKTEQNQQPVKPIEIKTINADPAPVKITTPEPMRVIKVPETEPETNTDTTTAEAKTYSMPKLKPKIKP
ncbi:MAG: hypothetical protein HQL25_04525 [Candidatus Omnitrophica bacterium]|nr:hypothetical protein [Candidatus Omnitrophota bacterium]